MTIGLVSVQSVPHKIGSGFIHTFLCKKHCSRVQRMFTRQPMLQHSYAHVHTQYTHTHIMMGSIEHIRSISANMNNHHYSIAHGNARSM